MSAKPATQITADQLAAELVERGVPTETVLDAGLVLIEQEDQPIASLMAWIGKLGLPGFRGIGGL